MRLPVFLERDEDGVWIASIPALPGCHSQGQSRDEALENVEEAFQAILESYRKHGEAVPLPHSVEVTELELQTHAEGTSAT